MVAKKKSPWLVDDFFRLLMNWVAVEAASRQWWLLMYSWYGKTVTAVLICPFILYLFLTFEKVKVQQKASVLQLWVLLALTAWAGCMVAASSFLMVPFLLGVLGLCHFVRKPAICSFCIKLGICTGPRPGSYNYITR